MRLKDAETLFHVTPGRYTKETLHAIYRQAARLVHPDRGGDREKWDALQVAYQRLLTEVNRPRPCSECGGAKVRTKLVRGHFVSTPCTPCGGTGLHQFKD